MRRIASFWSRRESMAFGPSNCIDMAMIFDQIVRYGCMVNMISGTSSNDRAGAPGNRSARRAVVTSITSSAIACLSTLGRRAGLPRISASRASIRSRVSFGIESFKSIMLFRLKTKGPYAAARIGSVPRSVVRCITRPAFSS